jgi:hypothetical protein
MEGSTAVIEDVPAGAYEIRGSVRPVKADGNVDWQNQVASVYHEFEVLPIAEGELDVPLELGKVKVVRKGEIAPLRDLELDGPGGQKIRMAEYEGKVVLATICSGYELKDDPEIANLKKVYEDFRGREGFAMVAIVPSSSSNPIMRAMVRDISVPWPLGYTGGRVGTKLVWGLPMDNDGVCSVLIGRDGEVIADWLKGEELVRKVEEALAASSSSPVGR